MARRNDAEGPKASRRGPEAERHIGQVVRVALRASGGSCVTDQVHTLPTYSRVSSFANLLVEPRAQRAMWSHITVVRERLKLLRIAGLADLHIFNFTRAFNCAIQFDTALPATDVMKRLIASV